MIELLDREEFRALSRVRQQQYAERAILKLIEENSERGLTLQELRNQTPFSVSTVSKHLEVLMAKRRIFRVTRGSVAFYFPNGTPLNAITEKQITFGRHTYGVSLVQNNSGKSLYIQEMETDDIGLKRVISGIIIPIEAVTSISSLMQKVARDRGVLGH